MPAQICSLLQSIILASFPLVVILAAWSHLQRWQLLCTRSPITYIIRRGLLILIRSLSYHRPVSFVNLQLVVLVRTSNILAYFWLHGLSTWSDACNWNCGGWGLVGVSSSTLVHNLGYKFLLFFWNLNIALQLQEEDSGLVFALNAQIEQSYGLVAIRQPYLLIQNLRGGFVLRLKGF